MLSANLPTRGFKWNVMSFTFGKIHCRCGREVLTPHETINSAFAWALRSDRSLALFRSNRRTSLSTSWPDLVPATHAFATRQGGQDMDARDKRGHDDWEYDSNRTIRALPCARPAHGQASSALRCACPYFGYGRT